MLFRVCPLGSPLVDAGGVLAAGVVAAIGVEFMKVFSFIKQEC